MGALSLTTCLALSTLATSGQSADEQKLGFLEVIRVVPERRIEHEVYLRGAFDNEPVETFLSGPRFFSHAVGYGDDSCAEPGTYLNGYVIDRPSDQNRRTLNVRDALQGTDTYPLTIGKAVALLSPARRVSSGAPSPIPEGLHYFRVYAIVEGPSENTQVSLTGTLGPEHRKLLSAVYFCMPVEHRHHDEHTLVTHPNRCFVVYAMAAEPVTTKITTLDQFGMNTLQAESSQWLCVPVEWVREEEAGGE